MSPNIAELKKKILYDKTNYTFLKLCNLLLGWTGLERLQQKKRGKITVKSTAAGLWL